MLQETVRAHHDDRLRYQLLEQAVKAWETRSESRVCDRPSYYIVPFHPCTGNIENENEPGMHGLYRTQIVMAAGVFMTGGLVFFVVGRRCF